MEFDDDDTVAVVVVVAVVVLGEEFSPSIRSIEKFSCNDLLVVEFDCVAP
mgnify:CR=1 FL=1